ncbi:hypothetical protein CWE12_11375 [Aliidiomarina sedimenti]|uniref:DUF4377 domain-containing protein n=1 Tax=Aliidiomarina sedimenti TaxID=1933879 RepID=A0ABY0BXK0_9GAMM|nr:DUF4377 domain-containing protein [Aliidiomarina sedimenti]RUO28891.1 hypothetical protein CWE12_11375 [Aliidiomarina sedimenti]
MLKLKLLPLLLFSSPFLTGCNSSDDENVEQELEDEYYQEVVVIGSRPEPYYGFNTGPGYSVTDESGEQSLVDLIRDFTFEWGYTVTAQVEVVIYADPPDDGASSDIRVLEILDREEDEVGTLYNYDSVILDHAHVIRTDDNNEGYYLFLGHTFECAENIDCDQLVDMSNDGGTISLEFEYLGQSDDRPTAVMLTDWN